MERLVKSRFILFAFLGVALFSCSKLTDVSPTDVTRDDVLKTPEDVLFLLNSCYEVCANSFSGSAQNIAECLSDNLAEPENHEDYTQVYKRRTDFFNGTTNGFFGNPYIAIFRSNTLIQEADNFPGFSNEQRVQLKAEGRFIRALCYFELNRLYSQPYGFQDPEPSSGVGSNNHLGVVLRLTPNANAIPRATVNAVYSSIINDLTFCIENLGTPLLADSSNYIKGYASKSAAQALLAKVYFTSGRYDEAIPLLDAVLSNFGGTLPTDLDRFLMDASSPEAIFEYASEIGNERSGSFKDQYRSDVGSIPNLSASKEFYTLLRQDTSDQRNQWVDIANEGEVDEYYPVTKFNKDYFNVPHLHLTDMFLMRAEALGRVNGDLNQAKSDLDQIRVRAGLSSLSSSITTSPDLVIAEALKQRKFEMIAEGDEVFHQKRRGAIHDENVVVRGIEWYCNGMVIQFPNSEGTVSTFEYNPSTTTCQ
jgi:starch-binding outer membrane protein, SusD/RagB family